MEMLITVSFKRVQKDISKKAYPKAAAHGCQPKKNPRHIKDPKRVLHVIMADPEPGHKYCGA